MASTKNHLPVEYDEDLNNAELWAVIDSAAAAAAASKSWKPLALTNGIQSHSPVANYNSSASKFARSSPVSNYSSPALPPKFTRSPVPNYSSPAPKFTKNYRTQYIVKEEEEDGEVLHEPTPWIHQRPQKIARSTTAPGFGEDKRMVVVNHEQQRLPPPQITPFYSSPDPGRLSVQEISPVSESTSFSFQRSDGNQAMTHSLSGRFPSVPLFKEYQNAAMAILEKTDYTIISGSPFIKKSGWRKISFYFNLSFEIKDKNIDFDENRNVQHAEFVVRAYMQGGRFSDGWGSCDRREKRFMKPNHDIPSTAETRAKNKACQDLLGIGEYRLGSSNSHR